jgi:hypothetical protein
VRSKRIPRSILSMASDFETVVLFHIIDFRVDYSDFHYSNYHYNNSLHYSTHFRQNIIYAFIAIPGAHLHIFFLFFFF